jgi:hypothetical protein
MKITFAVALASASLVAALPGAVERRQTATDLTKGSGCKGVILIFARGTTEGGNIVGIPNALQMFGS